MPELSNTIIHKTAELEAELKNTGLWQKDMPVWVHGFEENIGNGMINFAQWLQFVFVPNHLQRNKTLPVSGKHLMVPHALKYFGDDVQKGKLLRILIEIDSLL
ncbi:MAG: YqcC family protein [Chitinophagaceae bacterium]